MTAPVETHATEVARFDDTYEANTRAQLAATLKFEPSELNDFDLADRAAGQMMGKLLAFLFCVLLFLMSGVNIWMMSNSSTGTDPQARAGAEASAVHR